MTIASRILSMSVSALLLTLPARGQTAQWVWQAPTEKTAAQGFFVRTFSIETGIRGGELDVMSEGPVTVFLNGKEIASSSKPRELLKRNVLADIHGGKNVVAVRADSAATPGFILVLRIEEEYGKEQTIISDANWQSAAAAPAAGWEQSSFDSKAWPAAVALQRPAPEGDLFSSASAAAMPAESLTVPAGFKVELLRSAHHGEGSWVSMAIDARGRLYVSPQGKEKILRVTLNAAGGVDRVEPLDLPVTSAMGMLWAFDSLYVSGVGPEGQAIYRLKDTNGDDVLDAVTLFKKVPGGGGEHGAHALVLGPDNLLYIAHGNSTPTVENIAPTSAHQHWEEDSLLGRINDPVATFFEKLKPPYGQVWRTDSEGKTWELFAGGFRNEYDIAFDADGELFTYDSDMEWDVGLPWYRPTRILHITSGAEYGFREGNGKWPEAYPDSVPAVVNVGLGCPTGVIFDTGSQFPEKYRTALFAMDWTFGRILAVHLKPKGASYTATNPLPSPYDLGGPNASEDVETFLSGKAMPVTDLVFGRDGAMYFTVGGRGTQSGLYRVGYSGPIAAPAGTVVSTAPNAARDLRHSLERFHGKEAPEAIAFTWPHLGAADRAIRYAARIGLEAQPVDQWRERALKESDPHTALTALLALARCGSRGDQEALLKAALKFDGLDEEWRINQLRVLEVSLTRQGLPSAEWIAAAREKLGHQFPAKTFALNRELSQLLVKLGAPDVVEKTLAVMRNSTVPAEQIWYANVLKDATTWSPIQREEYFAWFNKARDFKGGNSFSKFIARFKELALTKLSDSDKVALAPILDAPPGFVPAPPQAPERSFQKIWTMADLEPELAKAGANRNFARGREIFSSMQCVSCHHFGRDGGNVGPDLSAVGNRFNRHDLLEAIVEPSKVISEQYASYLFTTKSGDTIMGQIAEETDAHLVLVTDPLKGTRQEFAKGQIVSRQVSPISLMPPGLLSTLTREEVLDLLAFLEGGGTAAPNVP